MTTASGEDETGATRAVLGVGVTLASTAPFTVKIALDDRIGGPTAGLMFALGIVDKLGPEDLTGGKFIAGTGQIDVSGTVGADRRHPAQADRGQGKGATVFLVPAGNCAEAKRRPPDGLQLVKVGVAQRAVAR